MMEEEMRTLVLKLALILLAVGVAASVTVSGAPHISNNQPASNTTVVGYISDSSCGLKHMPGMGDDKSCTLMCVKGGNKFVLADGDHKVGYRLDKAGQEKAREFAGQKVKVTGVVTGKTIKVTAIEAAS